MKISELVNELNVIKKINGDIQVVINDADTGWLFVIKQNNIEVMKDNLGDRVEIDCSYNDETLDG